MRPQFIRHFAAGLIALGGLTAGAATASCIVLYDANCCGELSLNFTRVCGAFNDQDCPDTLISNPPIKKSAITLTGFHPAGDGSSVVCLYTTGRCRGSIGSNLCLTSAQLVHTCVNKTASAEGCATAGGIE